MMEWEEYKLKDLTSKIGSGATPRGGSNAYKLEGISFIRSQNILDFSFSYNGLVFIDDKQALKLKNVKVEPNDILINITGDSVARVCKVPELVLPARVNQHVAILRPQPDILLSDYLLYFLLNPTFKKHLLLLASNGGTRNALTKADLEELSIPLPPLKEQQAIAKTLSLLDDKISLLRQQNETLEQLAQTLFKRWFVDFEFPDAQGQPYKSAGGKMIESELGEIPEGWEVGSSLSIFNLIGGGTPKTTIDEYWKGNIPWYSVVDAPREGDVFVLHTEKNITQLGLNKSSTKLLRKGTTIISARGTVGKLAITGREMTMNQSCYGVQGKDGIGDYYVFFQLKESLKRLKKNVHGAVFDTITKATFQNLQLIIPSSNLLSSFEDSINPLMKKILNNNSEIQTLTRLRDTLLPKLMSGELRLGE